MKLKFESSKLGCGVENPLIKKDVFGYFADDLVELKKYIDDGKLIPRVLKDIDLELPLPYEDQYGAKWKYFYIVNEHEGVVFDEKRLGYGRENPLIKEGAKGIFSDSYRNIRIDLEDGYELETLKDIDLESYLPYGDEYGKGWALFYVIEEAEVKPLNFHKLAQLVGETFVKKEDNTKWIMEEISLRNGGLFYVTLHCEGVFRRSEDSQGLFERFTFENGDPIGEVEEEHDEV